MATDMISVRNTLNGQVTQVQPAVLDNPHLAKHLVVVADDAKPMVNVKPSTAEEFTSRRRGLKREDTKNLKTEDTDKTEEG